MKLETDNDQLMAYAAFRYCLGHSTYMVEVCCNWLKEHWGQFSSKDQTQIEAEILAAIEVGRAGAGMDVAPWRQLISWIDDYDEAGE